MPSVDRLRILHLDIENFPNLGYTWEKYEQNVLAFEEHWTIASFAYKWEGDRGDPLCVALPDFKRTYRNSPIDDSSLVGRLYDVLDEADWGVGHNIRRFDFRKIATRIVKHIGHPPSPIIPKDTLTIARKHFYFPSNKLGDLAEFLGCPFGGKVEHEGIKLWLKCRKRDMDAWARMRRYNIKDVKIGQWVWHKLRAWDTSPGNISANSGKSHLCPSCGSITIHRGWDNKQTYRAKRYSCLSPKCGRWSQGEHEKIEGVMLR